MSAFGVYAALAMASLVNHPGIVGSRQIYVETNPPPPYHIGLEIRDRAEQKRQRRMARNLRLRGKQGWTNNMDKFIKCWGAAKPLLPAYPVKMYFLDGNHKIADGDYLLIGDDEYDFHNWTSICSGSEFVGKTVKEANVGIENPRVFGRKGEF